MIVRRFELRRRYVADRLQQPTMIEPVDPFQRRVLRRIEVPHLTQVFTYKGKPIVQVSTKA